MELSALTRYFPSYFESPSLDSGKPTSAIFAVCMFLRYVLVMDTVDRRGGSVREHCLPRHNSRYCIPEIYQPVSLQLSLSFSLNINSIKSKLGWIRHGTAQNNHLSTGYGRKTRAPLTFWASKIFTKKYIFCTLVHHLAARWNFTLNCIS